MRRIKFLGLLTVALGAVGCQDQMTEPVAESHPVMSTTSELSVVGSPPTAGGIQISDADFASLARSAIDPGDYQCSEPPQLTDWLNDSLVPAIEEGALPDLVTIVNGLGAANVPINYAIYFQTDDTPQYIGSEGQFTHVVEKTERDVKDFWDIFSDDIQLIGAHGSILTDVTAVAPIYQLQLEVSPGEALAIASFVRSIILQYESLNGGDIPLFSLNAVAVTTFGGPIPDKIVMGDGLLEAFDGIGLGDVAPQALYAHEFAHHIQYENGYLADPIALSGDEAEASRYFELMADAMSAFYLTHKRGATLNWKRVQQFLTVFFESGDCGFSSPIHHGTPNQRMAAAQWGYELAQSIQKKGQIMTSDEVHDLFVDAYPDLIAPDNI